MTSILITGGAGFVGYFLAKRLGSDNNNNITILDNLSRGRLDDEFKSLLKQENINFFSCDLTETKKLFSISPSFDYIYHLAAVIGVRNVTENPDKVLYVNALSIMNMLKFANLNSKLKRFFFASTSEIYSGTLKKYGIEVPTPESVGLALDDLSQPRTTYMLSKMYGESACYAYNNKYNVPIIIGRYHNVYGPRMGFMHVIPEMFIKVKYQDQVDVPSANHTRAFCYIDDAVEMTIRSAVSEKTQGEVLHIGNGREEIKIIDLAQNVAKVVGTSPQFIELPETPGSPSRRCPDTTKAETLLDYIPQTNLGSGLYKTYEWYKTRLVDRYE